MDLTEFRRQRRLERRLHGIDPRVRALEQRGKASEDLLRLCPNYAAQREVSSIYKRSRSRTTTDTKSLASTSSRPSTTPAGSTRSDRLRLLSSAKGQRRSIYTRRRSSGDSFRPYQASPQSPSSAGRRPSSSMGLTRTPANADEGVTAYGSVRTSMSTLARRKKQQEVYNNAIGNLSETLLSPTKRKQLPTLRASHAEWGTSTPWDGHDYADSRNMGPEGHRWMYETASSIPQRNAAIAFTLTPAAKAEHLHENMIELHRRISKAQSLRSRIRSAQQHMMEEELEWRNSRAERAQRELELKESQKFWMFHGLTCPIAVEYANRLKGPFREALEKLAKDRYIYDMAARIQRCWKAHFRRRLFHLVMAFRRCAQFIMAVRSWKKKKCADLIKKFTTDFSRTKGTKVMKMYMGKVRKAQRTIRTFLACRRARIELIDMYWEELENEIRVKVQERVKEQHRELRQRRRKMCKEREGHHTEHLRHVNTATKPWREKKEGDVLAPKTHKLLNQRLFGQLRKVNRRARKLMGGPDKRPGVTLPMSERRPVISRFLRERTLSFIRKVEALRAESLQVTNEEALQLLKTGDDERMMVGMKRDCFAYPVCCMLTDRTLGSELREYVMDTYMRYCLKISGTNNIARRITVTLQPHMLQATRQETDVFRALAQRKIGNEEGDDVAAELPRQNISRSMSQGSDSSQSSGSSSSGSDSGDDDGDDDDDDEAGDDDDDDEGDQSPVVQNTTPLPGMMSGSPRRDSAAISPSISPNMSPRSPLVMMGRTQFFASPKGDMDTASAASYDPMDDMSF
mmetsp:Transcript_45140/g.141422  ORF Transcript_45140/g.141422 Transcript_45140/m.141422 type:complete len:799 (-) Transcript_45140:265-2661(-)